MPSIADISEILNKECNQNLIYRHWFTRKYRFFCFFCRTLIGKEVNAINLISPHYTIRFSLFIIWYKNII